MFRSWKLGKLFDIDVYIHWTFFLLILFVMYRERDKGIEEAVGSAAFLVAVFGCVLLHEFGHALTARRFGIPTLDITLYPIGGVARLKSVGERPWEEFWIAVAGPAVNVAIAALIGSYMLLAGDELSQGLAEFLKSHYVAAQLLFANLLLVGFNMLPAFPMDGGRVLRAILTTRLGRLRGTEIAANLSLVFTAIFLVGAYWHPMLLLISGFTYLAGQQELAMVRHIEYGRQRARTMAPHAGRPEDSVITTALNSDFSGLTWEPTTGTWTLWQKGRPVRSQWHENPK